MVFVRAIVSAYEKQGRDPGSALASARITSTQLRRPQGRIDAGQLESLSSVAMQELDDEALGWFSRRLPWGTYGMLCRASLGAPTLASALRRWCRHHRLVTEDVRLTLTPEAGGARLTVEERRAPGKLGPSASAAEVREFCLLTTLRYVLGYACWLVDSRLPLRDVTFPFAAPRHERVYPLLFFQGPVRFGAKSASMLRRRALPGDRAAARRARARPRCCDARCRSPCGPTSTIASSSTACGSSWPSAGAPVDRRAWRWRPRCTCRCDRCTGSSRARGRRCRRLKDEVRQRKATELLRRTTLPIKQVALAAGFASEKSFARAFRGWTGRVAERAPRQGRALA